MNAPVMPRQLGAGLNPILSVRDVSRFYGERVGCADVSFDLWPARFWALSANPVPANRPCCAAFPGWIGGSRAAVLFESQPDGALLDIFDLPEQERRHLMRTAWGIVHQNPRDGLRMDVSAGGNVGERLMDRG